jgi:hypothetical protein
LKLTFLERFKRQCRSASAGDQAAIFRALLDLEGALANPHSAGGLGLRKLHPAGIWELRAGLDLRVLFRLSKDEAVFLVLGTHDEVKRFLKSV